MLARRDDKFEEQAREDCGLYSPENIRRLQIKFGQVIFQDRDTVLKVGEKRYIARCEAVDEYDREKGLLFCLIKAMGLTTSDVAKLLDGAVVKNSSKKPKVVK